MSVLTSKVCRTCGTVFTGGPRAWYCPECRHARRLEKMRGYNAAIAAGTTRKIGSTSMCENCGKPYTVTSGRQKWCPDCRPEMIKQVDRELHRARAAKPATVADPPESKPMHKPKKDLTGQTFGRLTAVRYVGQSRWECRCSCGNVCTVQTCNLTRRHTTSCGCAKTNDLTGQKFGRLTVISAASTSGRPGLSYTCKCDCGNTVQVRGDSLTSGSTQSCGCFAEEQRIAALKSKAFINGTQPSKLTSTPTAANKSGVVGVNWDKARGKWQAGIRFKGKRYNLGRYEHLQDAIDARETAEKEMFGDFLKWYENQRKDEDND